MEETAHRRRAEEFLRTHLPQSDLDCYPWELFERFIDHALALRERTPWCGALDWESFAHYVLFPRVNDEDLSFHRELFCRALWPRVKDLPTQEARIQETNRWCREQASYQAQDERTASPLTVFRCGSGRCGEESAFLVSALRSVGIPARQVYAPRWSHCDDNHAWVEALCGDTWRFLGACEPEPVLDRGWFTTAASRAVLVHSRIFGHGSSPLHGTPLGREGGVTWFNQTARYAPVRRYAFQVLLEDARPAAGARVELQLLNEAAFHTIAVLTADGEGRAEAELGAGSVHVLARLGALTAEGECGEDGAVLRLSPPEAGERPWEDFDFRAPPDLRPAPAALSVEQKAEREAVRRRGDRLRREKLAGLFRPGREGCGDLLRAARGNCEALSAFLDGPDGEARERLVRTLSEKDLRDVSAQLLEDHLARLPPRRDGVPEEIYWQYTACPRIALEPLEPWRGALAERLAGREGDPVRRCKALSAGLRPPGERRYQNLYWTPAAALKAGACDEKSRELLLVAALRTLGVPARLRGLDGAAEYWENGAFRAVEEERTGVLRLSCPAGTAPRYGQDWSLSRREGGVWRRLAVEERWRGGALELTLPAGRYRIITTVRLPAGDQLASRCALDLGPGEARSIALRLRPWSVSDLLGRQSLPVLPAATLGGERIPDLFRTGEPVLALWLEEGGEPTEHLLNELMELHAQRAGLRLRTVFLLQSRESAAQPTLARALERLEGAEALLPDDWTYDLETAARQLGRDPDAPPLAVVGDGAGQAVYSAGGYRVGAGALLLQTAGCVKANTLTG